MRDPRVNPRVGDRVGTPSSIRRVVWISPSGVSISYRKAPGEKRTRSIWLGEWRSWAKNAEVLHVAYNIADISAAVEGELRKCEGAKNLAGVVVEVHSTDDAAGDLVEVFMEAAKVGYPAALRLVRAISKFYACEGICCHENCHFTKRKLWPLLAAFYGEIRDGGGE